MVHFINRDGEKITVKGSPGDTLLDLVINEDLDFDGFGTKALTHTHTGRSHTLRFRSYGQFAFAFISASLP